MIDNFGDGWTGNVFKTVDGDGDVTFSATLTAGGMGTESFCTGVGGECVDIIVSAGGYPSEVSWTLELDDGTLISGD